MKKVIIVGATSGIGKELAKVFSEKKYLVGVAGRRTELFEEIKKEIPENILFKRIDVTQTQEAMALLTAFIEDMGGVDIVVISAGAGFVNPDFDWEKEKNTVDVNVSGFIAMANIAYTYFCAKGEGQIVGISSIAAIRGGGSSPAYFASKAFVSNYMQGLRCRIQKMRLPITVTDIQPGFVDTALAQGEGLFWVASAEKAARQIYKAVEAKRKHAYITKRWRMVAWALQLAPDFIYTKLDV